MIRRTLTAVTATAALTLGSAAPALACHQQSAGATQDTQQSNPTLQYQRAGFWHHRHHRYAHRHGAQQQAWGNYGQQQQTTSPDQQVQNQQGSSGDQQQGSSDGQPQNTSGSGQHHCQHDSARD